MIKKYTLLIGWFIAIAIGISITFFTLNIQADLFEFELETAEVDDVPRAAILDQLHKDIPSEDFKNKVTKSLNKLGYEVDYYTTEQITVDFYKKLPTKNYGFIIFRGHALGEGAIGNSPTLFTGEKYDPHKYIQEQFQEHVGRGVPYLFSKITEQGGTQALMDKTYFVIGSKFVNELMEGDFNDSTIILGGCDTSIKKNLVRSFLNRGASNVIGWDGLVDAGDNDMVILDLLDLNLSNNYEIYQSVEAVMKKYEGKLKVPSSLVYDYSVD